MTTKSLSGWGRRRLTAIARTIVFSAIATIAVAAPPSPGEAASGAPPVIFLLVVTIGGTGTGTVTSSPPGISCSSSSSFCDAVFDSGSRVTLTATPTNGSSFAGWGGACTGTGACVVTMTSAMSVSASFTPGSNTNNSASLNSAVLPLSRSVQVGSAATAFATIINAGPGNATSCSIAPTTSLPANFVYQTTDPATNAVTGTANTPVNIAPGASQSFVIALTPTAAFAPTDVSFNFGCTNAASAPVLTGINTLNLSGSNSAVPDIVALAASSVPGYVEIPGASGSGAFAVATVNLGISATMTATADTVSATLPIALSLCQTNPGTGTCLSPAAASVATLINANATPTFGIFVGGSGTVADSPGTNRVFVRFRDSAGTLRGATSVAVRTR